MSRNRCKLMCAELLDKIELQPLTDKHLNILFSEMPNWFFDMLFQYPDKGDKLALKHCSSCVKQLACSLSVQVSFCPIHLGITAWARHPLIDGAAKHIFESLTFPNFVLHISLSSFPFFGM